MTMAAGSHNDIKTIRLEISNQLEMANANSDTSKAQLSGTVRDALEQLIAAIFPNRKCTYTLSKATEKGDNYIGVVYRVAVQSGPLRREKPFSLILKVPPENDAQRNQFFARPCFLREAMAYEEFLPLTKEYQESKAILLHLNGFCEYPNCYNSITEEYSEAIFMEDLCAEQYELFDRFRPLDKAHAALVMRAYGKLHAISFALKQEDPEKLQRYQHIQDIFEQRRTEAALNAYFEDLKKTTLETLDPEKDAKYVQVLKKYFAKGSFIDLLLDMTDGSRCEPYAVVCHGDCWINNFLFKEENRVPVDVRLLDWQLMRYSTPVSDLMYFIFTCTTKQLRQVHYHELLDIYYEELTEHLKRLGCEHERLFPRSALDEQLKRNGAIGLLMAMMVLPIITLKSEDTPDLQELSERIEAGNITDLLGSGILNECNTNAYKQRMRDTLMDSIDYGYVY